VASLEVRDLENFVAVAESLHFREAAGRLGTSQPVLSRAIARLERQLPDLEPDLASVYVENESPVALLPGDHPLAGRPSVSLADLLVLGEFRPEAPLQPTESLIDQVAMGLLVIIVGSSAAIRLRPSVVAVPVVDAPGATLRLAWLPGVHDPARDRFLAVARGLLID
jgi:hypothetical protein